jgi:glycosyltransferase involved in cell wall biosynthesis
MLYNLLHGMSERGIETTLLCGEAANLASEFRASIAGGPIRVRESGGNGSRFLAEQRACLQKGLSADAILFPNYYVPPVVPRSLGRVGVVMHDFQYRHFPQYFSAKKRAWLRAAQAYAMRRADRVIGISNFVCEDAVRLFGRSVERKLVHIPNPLSWDRFAAGLDAPRPCARPYILSVAAQYPHKNLETVIRAFEAVAKAEPEVQLVLVGQSYAGLSGVAAAGKHRGNDITALAESLGLSARIQFTGYVDDAALAQWYRHAEMFVYPSLFEGFGMPPVEALGFGLPTLTTGRTALPEVTRGLARTVVDPLDVAEWASAMTMMVRDPDQHRPSAEEVASLKAFYHPARIAQEYALALTS